jgi:hypothetical protein
MIMRAMVLFESMFGDTQAIADAVARGLSTNLEVETVEVGSAPQHLPDDVHVLIVGGPTHAFGLSRPATREDATRQADGAGVISAHGGLREWLADATIRPDVLAAAFDTRVNKPRMPGSAAHAAQRRLHRLGCTVLAPAESFYVTGTKGPLVDGEIERAEQWGQQLSERVTQHVST